MVWVNIYNSAFSISEAISFHAFVIKEVLLTWKLAWARRSIRTICVFIWSTSSGLSKSAGINRKKKQSVSQCGPCVSLSVSQLGSFFHSHTRSFLLPRFQSAIFACQDALPYLEWNSGLLSLYIFTSLFLKSRALLGCHWFLRHWGLEVLLRKVSFLLDYKVSSLFVLFFWRNCSSQSTIAVVQ